MAHNIITMIFRSALRSGVHRFVAQRKFASAVAKKEGGAAYPNALLNRWYSIFGKSTALYASWLVTLIVVGEYATGAMTDSVWLMNNYGKTFETVDWSKFDDFEEDDEDEEEDEDDDDDDE